MKDMTYNSDSVTALGIYNSSDIQIQNNNFIDSYILAQNHTPRSVVYVNASSSVSFIENTFCRNTAPQIFQADVVNLEVPNNFIFSNNTVEENCVYDVNVLIVDGGLTNIEVVKNEINNNIAYSPFGRNVTIGMCVSGSNVLVHDNQILYNILVGTRADGMRVVGIDQDELENILSFGMV
jgi:hypothetical protein